MLTVEELAGLPDELLKELRMTGSRKKRNERSRAKVTAERHRSWYVLNELPEGWRELMHAPSPLSGCVFIANSQSPLNATQSALLRVRPSTAMEQKLCQS